MAGLKSILLFFSAGSFCSPAGFTVESISSLAVCPTAVTHSIKRCPTFWTTRTVSDLSLLGERSSSNWRIWRIWQRAGITIIRGSGSSLGGLARKELKPWFFYTLLRLRLRPSPVNPIPRSARVAGSGTSASRALRTGISSSTVPDRLRMRSYA